MIREIESLTKETKKLSYGLPLPFAASCLTLNNLSDTQGCIHNLPQGGGYKANLKTHPKLV